MQVEFSSWDQPSGGSASCLKCAMPGGVAWMWFSQSGVAAVAGAQALAHCVPAGLANFFLALILILLGVPLSYFLWYRRLYNSLK